MFLTDVIKAVASVVKTLGPTLNVLLSFIKTPTNADDRTKLLAVMGILRTIGQHLINIADKGTRAVAADSPGGTAIDGTEYKSIADEIYAAGRDITNLGSSVG